MYDPTLTPSRTPEQLFSYIGLYGCLAGLGTCGLCLVLLVLIWTQWRVNSSFVQTAGLVVDQRDVVGEGGTHRQVRFHYSAEGEVVEHWNSVAAFGNDEEQLNRRLRAMAVGERHTVWYDPEHPEVVVERAYSIHWMLYPIIAGSGFFLLYGAAKIAIGVLQFGRPSTAANESA